MLSSWSSHVPHLKASLLKAHQHTSTPAHQHTSTPAHQHTNLTKSCFSMDILKDFVTSSLWLNPSSGCPPRGSHLEDSASVSINPGSDRLHSQGSPPTSGGCSKPLPLPALGRQWWKQPNTSSPGALPWPGPRLPSPLSSSSLQRLLLWQTAVSTGIEWVCPWSAPPGV